MKNIVKIIIITLSLAAFYSCGQNETASIKVSTNEIRIDKGGMTESNETAVFEVTSDKPWILTCTPWLITNVSAGGAGTTEVTVSATGTDEEREGFITVQNNFVNTVIKVKQSDQEMVASTLTILSVPDVEANGLMSDGSAPIVSFSTNKPWFITGSTRLFTATPNSGKAGTFNVNLTVSDNFYVQRELDLIINAGSISNGLILTQAGKINGIVNVALGKPTQESDYEATATGKFAVDGDRFDIMSRWLSADNTNEHWIVIDLEDQCIIRALGLWLCGYSPQPMWRFQAWLNGAWEDLVIENDLVLASLDDPDVPTAHPCKVYYKEFDPVITDKVRWYFPSYSPNNRANVYEIEVYGGVLE